ncbi:MAG: LamG domain-containing protein [Prosthecobacter sp.]
MPRSLFLTLVLAAFSSIHAQQPPARELPASLAAHQADLVAFWDFQEEAGQPRIAHGPTPYALQEMKGPIARSGEPGVFGPHCARIKPGQWFMLERSRLGALDIHGKDAQVTVVAWVRRVEKSFWQAIAGVWDETRGKRQYCLFLNAPQGTRADEMKRHPLQNRIHGHVSGVGGPTPGQGFCITYSSSGTEIPLKEWHCLAMTYDGRESRVYLDGKLDSQEHYNPFPYTEGLFDGGTEGSPFTVGAVHRGGTWGNFFGGQIGGLAIYSRALDETEMQALVQAVPLPAPNPAKKP